MVVLGCQGSTRLLHFRYRPRDKAREPQTTGRGTFVPLAFGLGEAFQFDWSEDWAIIGNERTKLPEAIRFHQADVTDTAAILPALDGENGLHGFVHCAGILRHEREWQIADFDVVMQVNVSAGFALANALLPRLETAGGSIVMLASMWAIFGSVGAPAYTASKGAVAAVTRSMAVVWAPRGVRVNSVAPGWVETRMSARAGTASGQGASTAAFPWDVGRSRPKSPR